MYVRTAASKYKGLQTAITKRLSSHWQGSATYTLSGLWDREAQPVSGIAEVPFPVAKDLGNDFTFSTSDQRHRAVMNGIWEVGHGFQMSGLFFLGVGQRPATIFQRLSFLHHTRMNLSVTPDCVLSKVPVDVTTAAHAEGIKVISDEIQYNPRLARVQHPRDT